MVKTKVYMEVILDVDGNLEEASERLCEQMSKLNYSSVSVNKNESFSYNVIEAKDSKMDELIEWLDKNGIKEKGKCTNNK